MLKAIFSRHGILEIVRSDDGPQFSSKEFSTFAEAYGFLHKTSSPHYPQSNGQVECMVQTVKHLLKKSADPNLAILAYRATSLPWCGQSPSELLMGRKLHTTVPQTAMQLTPNWSYLPQFRKDYQVHKTKLKEQFDDCHRVQINLTFKVVLMYGSGMKVRLLRVE